MVCLKYTDSEIVIGRVNIFEFHGCLKHTASQSDDSVLMVLLMGRLLNKYRLALLFVDELFSDGRRSIEVFLYILEGVSQHGWLMVGLKPV